MVRRYQTARKKPVLPIPLACVSGANGTWILADHLTSLGWVHAFSGSSAKSHSPLSDVQCFRSSCGRGYPCRLIVRLFISNFRSGRTRTNASGSRFAQTIVERGGNMRVLVTGGAGYIGSVITDQLVAGGHKVVVYDNLSKGHADAVNTDATLVEADLLDVDRLKDTLTDHQVDAVIHMAASSLVGE